MKKADSKFDQQFYDKSPYLSITEDLLESLKDNLVDELVIISSFRKKESGYPPSGDPRKRKKFGKAFGKFPGCKLELIPTFKSNDGKHNLPRRWTVLESKFLT